MALPLNYRNAKATPPPQRAEPVVPAAIPIEFDVLLTQTEDHAAASAIEAALGRAGIQMFRPVGHVAAYPAVQLYVRAADRERAAEIAAQIFVRRKKIKSFPRPKIPPDGSRLIDGTDLSSLLP
jgi:hypothetical protein